LNWSQLIEKESGGKLKRGDLIWYPDASISLDALVESAGWTSLNTPADVRYVPLVASGGEPGLWLCREHCSHSGSPATVLLSGSSSDTVQSWIDNTENSSENRVSIDSTSLSVLFSKDPISTPSNAIDLLPYESIGFGPVSQVTLALYALERLLQSGEKAPSVFVPISSRLIAEISKLRSLRSVLNHLAGIHGQAEPSVQLHSVTSRIALDERAPDNNLIRCTVHAMAAVMGGSDVLSIQPWNVNSRGHGDPEARRLASNILHILNHESNLSRVSDPLSGSFTIEKATHEFSQLAWKRFLQIKDLPPALLSSSEIVLKWLKDDRNHAPSPLVGEDSDRASREKVEQRVRDTFSFPAWRVR